MQIEILALGGSVAITLIGVGLYLFVRRGRQSSDTGRLQTSVEEGTATPPSLHPIIDADICIGSLSCIKACPEGSILGLVEGKANLVEASHCIGHSKCAVECPVDAIKLVFGTQEKGVDLPETDEDYESSKPGVYVIGELGGMGLIKNAIRQGLGVAEVLKRKLPPSSDPDVADVIIVGGGPSGIAAAVGLANQGLSYRLLEQDTLGGTVAHYPRGKVVMTESVHVPNYGSFGRTLIKKEDLLVELKGIMDANNVVAEENTRVTAVNGELGKFTVSTSQGDMKARAVILAIGLRGTPRKLGVPGEELEKVTYRLVDASQYNKQKLLVVGGGDSALEAAIQLADESSASVAITYRKDAFARAKPRNRELIAQKISSGRVVPIMSAQPQMIKEKEVRLLLSDGSRKRVRNDKVIVCIGGELPTKFLKSAGVHIRRYQEQEKGTPTNEDEAKALKRQKNKASRRLGWSLAIVGALIVAGLLFAGQDYYFMAREAKLDHPLHEWLKPAGLWGHGVGIMATLVMMSNFIYALRKRWKRLKGVSSIRTWMTFHVFVGLMSPFVIAFHAAFQSNNILATWTWGSLGIVVGTGIFGRFMFRLLPAHEGKVRSLDALKRELKETEDKVHQQLTQVLAIEDVYALLDQNTDVPQAAVPTMIIRLPGRRFKIRRTMRALKRRLKEGWPTDDVISDVQRISLLRWQIALYRRMKNLFRVWLAFHVILASLMVLLIAAHIGVSLLVGYAWIFSGAN